MAGLTTADIEDGTGLQAALVYDDVATAIAYLDRRGGSALASLDETKAAAALVLATEAAEAAVRSQVRGVPVNPLQGLLFPAQGAYDASGRLMELDERPARYREGIFLLAEAAAGPRGLTPLADRAHLSSEGTGKGSMVYNTNVDVTSVRVNHKEAWSKISTVICDRW